MKKKKKIKWKSKVWIKFQPDKFATAFVLWLVLIVAYIASENMYGAWLSFWQGCLITGLYAVLTATCLFSWLVDWSDTINPEEKSSE